MQKLQLKQANSWRNKGSGCSGSAVKMAHDILINTWQIFEQLNLHTQNIYDIHNVNASILSPLPPKSLINDILKICTWCKSWRSNYKIAPLFAASLFFFFFKSVCDFQGQTEERQTYLQGRRHTNTEDIHMLVTAVQHQMGITGIELFYSLSTTKHRFDNLEEKKNSQRSSKSNNTLRSIFHSRKYKNLKCL